MLEYIEKMLNPVGEVHYMSNNDIKISVIMPIYNAYDYLRPALDTVLDQTVKEIELICIDDGSTDHSLEIIKEYQARDSRIRIVTENNAGASVARNKGIIRVRGEFLIFLDADDFYEPTLLEKLYNRAIEDELDIAVCLFDVYNDKHSRFTPGIEGDNAEIFAGGKVTGKSEHPDSILASTTGYVWNKLFRTSFIKEKELAFAPELYIFEDIYFVCAALSLANRVARVEEVLVHHRVYKDQSRQKLFRKYYEDIPKMFLKVKEFLMKHGMYIPLSKSFLNLSASRCYKTYNLLWHDAKRDFWDILHGGAADSLGWYQHEAEDFDHTEVCDFAANVGLYTHEQYEKRSSGGKRVNIDKLTKETLVKRINRSLRLERIGDALARFFSKFKKKKNKED